MNIEGIPEGWELVRIGECKPYETKLSKAGEPLTLSCGSDDLNCVIIRKIEHPKQYRPFAKPVEAQPLIGEVLRLKLENQCLCVFIGITTAGFQIGLSHWKPKEAFDCFERLDGTPFGIEVTE